MKFAFVDQYKGPLTQVELCTLLEVSARGYRAWRIRPMKGRAPLGRLLCNRLPGNGRHLVFAGSDH